MTERSEKLLYKAENPKGWPLTPEILWAIPRVGAPAPSPDGKRLVVPVTNGDLELNESRTQLWLVDALGKSDPRPLTGSEVSSSAPRVSPDGTRVAFLRKGGSLGKPQLHVMPLDGGEAERLTDLPLGAADPRWFPDGRRIALRVPLYRGHLTPEATKARVEAAVKDPVKAHVTEDRVFRYWDRWLTDGEVPHIFVLDLDTKTLRDLTPGLGRWFELMEPDGQYDLSPDGAEVAFSACASDPPYTKVRWAIYTAPVAGGEPLCLTPDHTADDLRPRYSPDGTSIVYGMQVDPFFYADRVRLVRFDRKARRHDVLTEGWDRSAGSWEFTGDNRLVIEAEDCACSGLFLLDPSKGPAEPKRFAEGGVASGLAVAGNRAFYGLQTLSQPAEIHLREVDAAGGSGEQRRLTRFTDRALEGVARGEVREVIFAGSGGAPVQMYVILPPGAAGGSRPPLVHVIHGGPHAISGDQWHARWNAQLFAAPGYAVACVNFHGSTSWGQKFAQCIQGGWGDKPMADIEAATDWLIEHGLADQKRMAIAGGSYGGYLVSWIGARTKRYACIVNHAGVFDLLSQYATDVTQGRHASFGGEPWDGLDRIDRWSPSREAAGLTTPMLVIHGERDYRVPVTQGLEAYNILKAKGVEARLIYFPDENHWVLKPRNSVFWYREVAAWLARFLDRRAP